MDSRPSGVRWPCARASGLLAHSNWVEVDVAAGKLDRAPPLMPMPPATSPPELHTGYFSMEYSPEFQLDGCPPGGPPPPRKLRRVPRRVEQRRVEHSSAGMMPAAETNGTTSICWRCSPLEPPLTSSGRCAASSRAMRGNAWRRTCSRPTDIKPAGVRAEGTPGTTPPSSAAVTTPASSAAVTPSASATPSSHGRASAPRRRVRPHPRRRAHLAPCCRAPRRRRRHRRRPAR